ncbi:GNAT family N-acetyltransferase [Rosistilla oblonga]|uniref:GNAT family N-acetyltransferase n=1 Tax=Rosistilla oblonga TaxID=2527990 RepID=UPI003A9803CE
MSGVRYPDGWRVELLDKSHNRKSFRCGQAQVESWLKKAALQSQKKHLSSTKVLLDADSHLVGYYTLATSQVDFSDLPAELARSLPQRRLPVAVLAWLGIASSFQRRGIGQRLLATALKDCLDASQTFSFIAVILDCVDESSKQFYQRFDFATLPGYPMRMYLPFKTLQQMAKKN